jgi:uncharacterized protein (UPF0248 family)
MITAEKMKLYFWYMFGVVGIVFFWAGVWDGIGNLSYLQNPWISLLVGILMLTLSGLFFKGENSFWGAEKTAETILHKVHKHPQKQEFHIKYHDRLKRKDVAINAGGLQRIEKGFLVILQRGKTEIFIPIHRVTEVLHKGKTHWKV